MTLRSLIKPVRAWVKSEKNGTEVLQEEPKNEVLKARKKAFTKESLVRIRGSQLTIEYLKCNGFECPLIIEEDVGSTGLQLHTGLANINTHVNALGGTFVVEVVDVESQEPFSMTLDEFSQYWKSPPSRRTKTLNIISLHVGGTDLEEWITPPTLVKEISWVETLAGFHVKREEKVDKYVLLSSKYSYTNFHIDFGGSSVWFYVIKGWKLFYLVPPTPENLRKYESWRDDDNSQVFFGDCVDVCYELKLDQGHLMLMPGGWIHAVYTPIDTISVSGNFLHSFSIPTQLRVQVSEEERGEDDHFRFPGNKKLNRLAGNHLACLLATGWCLFLLLFILFLLRFASLFLFSFLFFFQLFLSRGRGAVPMGDRWCPSSRRPPHQD